MQRRQEGTAALRPAEEQSLMRPQSRRPFRPNQSSMQAEGRKGVQHQACSRQEGHNSTQPLLEVSISRIPMKT